MSKRMEKNKFFLLFFAQTRGKQRQLLLQLANREQFLCLLEGVANILLGHVKVTSTSTLRALKRHRETFRQLCFNKKTCWKKKKRLLETKPMVGGILGTLAAAAGTFLLEKLWNKITASHTNNTSTPPPPPLPPHPDDEGSLIEKGV